MIESLKAKGLRTEQDIEALVSWLGEPVLSTRVNCGNPDHRSPSEFLASVLLGRVGDFVVWANRAGSKSYLAGLIAWAKCSFTPGLEATVLGGSFEQSEKAYKAMNNFWKLTKLQDQWLETEPTKRLTLWRNGSQVGVLTASTRSARGPHPNLLLLDEIDEMDEEVYRSALSQPISKGGIPAMLGKLSTNHRFDGMMDEALARAEEAKVPVFKWCVWDCMSSCRDYVCSTCKLSVFCPGEQMKEADGYFAPHDFVQKLENLSETTLSIEWFCRKAGRSDLVYGAEFDEDLHCPLNLPGFNSELPVLVSVDWGGTNPFSVGAWQRRDFGWVRFDELYQAQTTNKRLLAEAKGKPWWPNVRRGVADPSRPDLIREWKDEGVELDGANNDVDMRVEAVRDALRPVIGSPKFYVNRACRNWRAEVKSYYQSRGRPIKEHDHAMDETGYFVLWQIGARVSRKGRVYVPEKDEKSKGTPEEKKEGEEIKQKEEESNERRRGRIYT